MTGQYTYPFFRDKDEQTQAVIGAEAVAADLGGTYQKPYAVLTQKRLYCKNEYGNFITDADSIFTAGQAQGNPSLAWLLWGAFALIGLYFLRSLPNVISGIVLLIAPPETLLSENYASVKLLFCGEAVLLVISLAALVGFLTIQKRNSKIASRFLCISSGCLILCNVLRIVLQIAFFGYYIITDFIVDLLWIITTLVLVVIYFTLTQKKDGSFVIAYSGGSFTFSAKDYPVKELSDFDAAVKILKAGGDDGE